MYTIYVLKSEVALKSYVGVTDNLERRIAEHNSGKNFYTKRHLLWKVVYTEKFASFIEAHNREKYF